MKPMEIAVELLRRHPKDFELIADLMDKILHKSQLGVLRVSVKLLRVHPSELSSLLIVMEHALESEDPAPIPSFLTIVHRPKKHGTYLNVAYDIIQRAGHALSAMEIARRAQGEGVQTEIPVEKLRSRFSAVIAKQMKEPKPMFHYEGRGQIQINPLQSSSGSSSDTL